MVRCIAGADALELKRRLELGRFLAASAASADRRPPANRSLGDRRDRCEIVVREPGMCCWRSAPAPLDRLADSAMCLGSARRDLVGSAEERVREAQRRPPGSTTASRERFVASRVASASACAAASAPESKSRPITAARVSVCLAGLVGVRRRRPITSRIVSGTLTSGWFVECALRAE